MAKSLAPLNVKGHGKVHVYVPYQKPQLKSMAHAAHQHRAQCINAMRSDRAQCINAMRSDRAQCINTMRGSNSM